MLQKKLDNEVTDPLLEQRLCILATPVMLVIAIVFNASSMGSFLQRTFFGMPLHELGHAVTAWFCGFNAIPTFWFTITPDERGFIAPIILLLCLCYFTYRLYSAGYRLLTLGCGVLILLQLIGTFGFATHTARLFITFGGDGAGMVLATVLMASFFFGKNTQLYKGWLRWGFLAIGAAAFIDIYSVWWQARDNIEVVPYGAVAGTPSDVYKLVQWHGWDFQTVIRRYFLLGNVCLVVLMLNYIQGVCYAIKQVKAWQLAKRIHRNSVLAKDHLKRPKQ